MSEERVSERDRPPCCRGTIVFFSIDALGHIQPILSLAKELIKRHYRAVILTTRPLVNRDQLRQLGLEVEHVESQASNEKAADAGDSQQAMNEVIGPLIKKFRLSIRDAFESTYGLEGAVSKYLDDAIRNHQLIERKLRSFKPDLIVCDHVVGIPCVTIAAPCWVRVYSGFPSVLYSTINDTFTAGLGLKLDEMDCASKQFELATKRQLRQRVREFWASQGLGEADWPFELDLAPTSPYLNFYLGPQELGLEHVPRLKKLPENVWYRLEHTIDNAGQEENCNQTTAGPPELVKWLASHEEAVARGDKSKLIYFSLGTLVSCDVELINRLLEILSKSPNRFIVSMGQMYKSVKLYANMWGDRFVNQKAILAKADLFITHGGHNSIIEAFYHGVPSGVIVLPVFADQFDSAQRVQDCAFGARLNPYNCTQTELLHSIDSQLNNNELRKRMQTIGYRLRSIKYHEIAVDKLEQLIITTRVISADGGGG